MTVKSLIKLLKIYNQDMEVKIEISNSDNHLDYVDVDLLRNDLEDDIIWETTMKKYKTRSK